MKHKLFYREKVRNNKKNKASKNKRRLNNAKTITTRNNDSYLALDTNFCTNNITSTTNLNV